MVENDHEQGPNISRKKLILTRFNYCDESSNINPHGENLETGAAFSYLGSTVTGRQAKLSMIICLLY